MRELGFHRVSGDDYLNSETGIRVENLHDENVVYFANTVEWARRYGNWVTVANIWSYHIYTIDYADRDTPGTTANDLMTYVSEHAGSDGWNYRDQMPWFKRFVGLKRNGRKRALFIQSGGEGQIVVYVPTSIRVSYAAEYK